MNTQERMIEKRPFWIVVIAVAAVAVLVIAALTGAASAASLQAGDMIPDANTFAAVAARSATADDTPQVGDMIPDASTIAAFAAQSANAESASNAETQWQILQRQAYGLAQGSQTAQSGLATAQSQTWADSASNTQTQWQILQSQAYGLARASQGSLATGGPVGLPQLASSSLDDSIEAPQVAAGQAMRLAQASQGSLAAGGPVVLPQLARLQDPTLATPAQSAQTAQTVGGPVVLPTGVTSQVAILAEAGSQMAILQAAPAQSAQTAQLVPSHYDSLGIVTSEQARALGLPALAGVKEMAEERSRLAISQDPTLLALVQAEQASQPPQIGGGPAVSSTNAEAQHEATESPAEVAQEAAEAAQNPGVSMLQVFP